MRRGISIILLVVIVFASREVATVYSAPNREWRRSLIELLHGQHRQTALRDLLTPNSGEEVLPSLVRDMLTLLRRHGIQEFALSPEISASMVPNQRIVESAFPRKMVPTARHLLALAEEQLPVKCVQVAVEGGVQIAACN